jgi:hypothetical protein
VNGAPLLLLAALAWPSADEARTASRTVLADERYQQTLPPAPEPTTHQPSSAANTRPTEPENAASAPSEIGTVVLMVLGGLLLFGVGAVTNRELRAAKAKPSPAQAPAAPVELAASLIDDAAALAAEGRFGEAVHALLLRTFEALAHQAALPRALTSREILARVPLQPTAHAALAELVSAVEITQFGGAEADATDYARCADAFAQVLAADGVRAR